MALTQRITAEDGHTFDVRISGDSSASEVLILPAMGVRATFYHAFADALALEGFRVAVCDLRGHGTSSVRPRRSVDFGYAEMLEFDFPAVTKVFDGDEFALVGHSLGGQLGLIYSGIAPVRRTALVACCVPHYEGFEGGMRRRVRAAGYALPALASLVGHFPGQRVGFAGRESRGVMKAWARSARDGDYGARWESTLRQVETPILAVEVAGDAWAPRTAIERLTAKCPDADVTHVEIPCGSGHAHFGWVKEVAPAVDVLANFLRM